MGGGGMGGWTMSSGDEENRGPPSVSRPPECHGGAVSGAAASVDCSACALLAASTLKQMQNEGCRDQVTAGMKAAMDAEMEKVMASGDENEQGMAQFGMALVTMMITALPATIETF